MDRPNGYPLILTDEQAAALEGRALFNVRLKTERSYVDPTRAPREGKPLPGVGNYDVAYTDPATPSSTSRASCARPTSPTRKTAAHPA